MRKNMTEIVFILDRSGSMSGLETDTIGGFNSMIEKQKAEDAALERERKIQADTLAIKKKYGKNAILKAMNLEEGATAKDRNAQIGGHKA